jgi:hypothetical protein
MGKGIDMARVDAPEHAALLDDFKDQLLIAFLNRMGGKLVMPIAEVDATGAFCMALRVDPDTRSFEFELVRKQ